MQLFSNISTVLNTWKKMKLNIQEISLLCWHHWRCIYLSCITSQPLTFSFLSCQVLEMHLQVFSSNLCYRSFLDATTPRPNTKISGRGFPPVLWLEMGIFFGMGPQQHSNLQQHANCGRACTSSRCSHESSKSRATPRGRRRQELGVTTVW